ncbi:hypothetical protein PG991_011082 [Apiospora marii]|uniref:Kinesin motor domain-containing protein n=1 Tax=Apiospora marii TaxID=335849 RepID=A0ABR1RD57_9PEZI
MNSRATRGERPSAAPTRTGAAGRASARPANTGTRDSTRPVNNRTSALRHPVQQSAAASSRIDRTAAPSPALSVASTPSAKRKDREFEIEGIGEETNINVVVRCRGRNDREVSENSAVVVETQGRKGNIVELSMGPSALSNKSYNFDRVFSQAADQALVYDDVVKPILEEMLGGYNCTIFAYGQTGTGKTYTMSGDMTTTFGMLADQAGIIPRVLHSLFKQLEETDSIVKCSFIELYNEELRDLITKEENIKLKIYDDTSRKGHATTVVQGMEESHIKSAADGIKLLQEGSLKRQVAATKCNDLSSRSHTVFTITACIKRTGEDGEDYVSAGKLNLVDLAGSENIQRSGAENKRAAEAGLINKSLLTPGAKNIRNKPQANQMINKKTLLKEFAYEIERLKGELITTRQRNGVYLSNEAYEEMTVESESRRIQTEEQGAKIETLESNLRNKIQELFSLTSNFMGLKEDHDATRSQLGETQGVLDQTELVLEATRKSLAEENHIRKAHEKTEEEMRAVGGQLISTLQKTVSHVSGLHAKNKRKSDIQALNRNNWGTAQEQVSDVTSLVESRVDEFRGEQEQHISNISERMQSFVQSELQKLSSTQSFLETNLELFAESKKELTERKERSKEEMDQVLEEIQEVRDHIKERVGESLQTIAGAAEKIAQDVLSELGAFHNQLHTSYASLGKDFKAIFEDLLKHITSQKKESDSLRAQLEEASETIVLSNQSISSRIQEVISEERRQAAEERQDLLLQITSLINSQAELQESRLANRAASIQQSMRENNSVFEGSVSNYSQAMDGLSEKEGQLLSDVAKSRDTMKTKLQDDWNAANKYSTAIQATTKSVHAQTVRVVDEQMTDLDEQMTSLDDFVTRAKLQNSEHHNQHGESLQSLSETVEESYDNIGAHFKGTFARVQELESEMGSATEAARDALEPLEENLCQPLSELREDISGTALQEYNPTGETPKKMSYEYPKDLPQTKDHAKLIAELHGAPSPTQPTNPPSGVFADADLAMSEHMSPSHRDSLDDQVLPFARPQPIVHEPT